MASQFRSLLDPFIIMFSIPVASLGVGERAAPSGPAGASRVLNGMAVKGGGSESGALTRAREALTLTGKTPAPEGGHDADHEQGTGDDPAGHST